MYKDILNKKVLITGSSSGIGLEIAKDFNIKYYKMGKDILCDIEPVTY